MLDQSTEKWLDEKFARVMDMLKQLCDAGEKRDETLLDHEKRISRGERLDWLLAIIGTLLLPVAIESIKQLLGF